MRHISRALVGVVLVACCSQTPASAESKGWWPFSKGAETKVVQPPAVAAPSTSPLPAQRPSGTLAQLPAAPSQAPLNPQSPLPSTSADAAEKEHWMLSSPKGKVGWPKLTKPHLPKTGLFAEKPATDATRNSWTETTPPYPKPSPLKPITDGAHKVSKSTKAAWHKTVDALTPGEPAPAPRGSSARIAKRDAAAKPSVWKRMFGPDPEPQGSQTMPGFIAQQRVETAPNQTR